MGIVTVKADNDGAWPNARFLPSGHFATYYSGPRVLRLLDPAGHTIAETGVPGGVRDFDVEVMPSGEVAVYFSDYNNDKAPWAWKRWDTGAHAGGSPPPPGGTTSFPGAIQPDGSTVLNGVDFEGQGVRVPQVQVWVENSKGEVWTRAWGNGALGPWSRVS
jgi:hypothetical protein